MTVRETTKYLMAPALIVLAVLALIFGAYLPLEKSQALIVSLNQVGNAKSIQEFESVFNATFDLYSPVGQPESLRFFGNQIVGILSNKLPADVAQALIDYADGVFETNRDKGGVRGLNRTQTELIQANIHYLNWANFKKEEDFKISEEHYLKAEELSPNRPQALYGLLQLYMSNEDLPKVREVAEKILTVWPNDQKLKEFVATFPK
jgi:tetratricopeptide (TPR) repeat protein